LSDEQKKTTGEHFLGVPGVIGGVKPGIAPLPGAGKPGAAPLPGAPKPGAAKPGVAPLPGLGAQKAGRLLQQTAKAAAPKGPSQEQLRRDPFATHTAPAQSDAMGGVPSMGMYGVEERISIPPPVIKTRITQRQKLAAFGIGIGLILIGFLVGWIVAGRVEKAIMVRDARIIQYEVDKLGALFTEVDGALATAYQNAQANKFDKGYLQLLSEKLQGIRSTRACSRIATTRGSTPRRSRR
jgi:hypothetical protein